VWYFPANLKEIRNKLALFAQVGAAKAGHTYVVVHVNVEYSDGVEKRQIEGLSDRFLIHHRPDGVIINVVLVGDRVVLLSQDNQGTARLCSSDREERDTLSGKTMSPCEVDSRALNELSGRTKYVSHRNASKWPARTAKGG
jgi:hypothetical protein